MAEVKIYFNDLTTKKKKELLEASAKEDSSMKEKDWIKYWKERPLGVLRFNVEIKKK